MTEELLNAYAFSNLQRAIMTQMLADSICRETDTDPANALQEYYNDIRFHLETSKFSSGNSQTEIDQIRDASLVLIEKFFQDVESVLLKRDKIKQRNLQF